MKSLFWLILVCCVVITIGGGNNGDGNGNGNGHGNDNGNGSGNGNNKGNGANQDDHTGSGNEQSNGNNNNDGTASYNVKSLVTKVRSIDGSGEHPDGTAGAALLRLKEHGVANYSDGVGELRVGGPNPRTISNLVFDQGSVLSESTTIGTTNSKHWHADMVWQWGQFLDHDITMTPHKASNGIRNIDVESKSDIMYPKIKLTRSDFTTTSSTSPQREQVNAITAFIDASMVYGSDSVVAESLRTHVDGLLKMENDILLPIDHSSKMFMAGDKRVNEQLGLLSMHTLFAREHNRLATKIKDYYDMATSAHDDNDINNEMAAKVDEQIYQLARKIVGAEIQIITYREFLPVILGQETPRLEEYNGFVPTVNPGIANIFSTAAFRFGHTMLSPDLTLADGATEEDHPAAAAPTVISLMETFFTPQKVQGNPVMVEQLIYGLCTSLARDIGTRVIDDVRNFLFEGVPSVTGLDLVALNIQRGRDHGLPTYNAARKAYGLEPLSSFGDVTSNENLAKTLQDLYGTPEDMDVWVGGLAEDHATDRDAAVGPLFAAILRDQFLRLRDGDPFFYLNDTDLTDLPKEIIDLDHLTLSLVIRENTKSLLLKKNQQLPEDVFTMTV